MECFYKVLFGMIKKNMMKSCPVFHREQKMVFKKFNCFFINLLRYSFERIKVILTVIEKEYTPGITFNLTDLLCMSVD